MNSPLIFGTYFSGWIELDVRWGYGIRDFDPWPLPWLPWQSRVAVLRSSPHRPAEHLSARFAHFALGLKTVRSVRDPDPFAERQVGIRGIGHRKSGVGGWGRRWSRFGAALQPI